MISPQIVNAERRKTVRAPAKEGVFVTLGPSFTKLGQVMDISKRGLSFRYIDDGKSPVATSWLTLFIVGDDFLLERVNFKLVSDQEVTNEYPNSVLRVRKCSVQFQTLSEGQLDKLDYILRSCLVLQE
jgi:hypothetical protein